MPVIHRLTNHILYWCPGCNREHAVDAKRWNWNGDVELPTLSPSVRHFSWSRGVQKTDCHYFVRNGIIEYCGDCPHGLKGQSVKMVDVEVNDDPEMDEFHIIRPVQ